MSWKCPLCDEINEDGVIKCVCGFENENFADNLHVEENEDKRINRNSNKHVNGMLCPTCNLIMPYLSEKCHCGYVFSSDNKILLCPCCDSGDLGWKYKGHEAKIPSCKHCEFSCGKVNEPYIKFDILFDIDKLKKLKGPVSSCEQCKSNNVIHINTSIIVGFKRDPSLFLKIYNEIVSFLYGGILMIIVGGAIYYFFKILFKISLANWIMGGIFLFFGYTEYLLLKNRLNKQEIKLMHISFIKCRECKNKIILLTEELLDESNTYIKKNYYSVTEIFHSNWGHHYYFIDKPLRPVSKSSSLKLYRNTENRISDLNKYLAYLNKN